MATSDGSNSLCLTYNQEISHMIERLRNIVCIEEQDSKLNQNEVLEKVLRVVHHLKDGGNVEILRTEKDNHDFSVTSSEDGKRSKVRRKVRYSNKKYGIKRRTTQNALIEEMQDFLDGLVDEFDWLKEREKTNMSRNNVLLRIYVYLAKMMKHGAIMPQGVVPQEEMPQVVITRKTKSFGKKRYPEKNHHVLPNQSFIDPSNSQTLTSNLHSGHVATKPGTSLIINNEVLPSALPFFGGANVVSVQTSTGLKTYTELTPMVFPSPSGENSSSEVMYASLLNGSDGSLYQAQFASIAPNFFINE